MGRKHYDFGVESVEQLTEGKSHVIVTPHGRRPLAMFSKLDHLIGFGKLWTEKEITHGEIPLGPQRSVGSNIKRAAK